MTYLLIGEDSLNKDSRIAEIKQKVLGIGSSSEIDIDVLHSHKLKAADLKKSLISLPAIAKKRLIIIRSVQKLDKHNKELLLDSLGKDHAHVVIVMDFEGNGLDGRGKKIGFLTRLEKFSDKVEQFGIYGSKNVFDVGNLIFKNKPADALKLLSELFGNGEIPVALLGGLLWKWSNSKRYLSKENYKKGLLKFQEADLNVKRSRIEPEYALELLVINLCQLAA